MHHFVNLTDFLSVLIKKVPMLEYDSTDTNKKNNTATKYFLSR